MTFCTRVLVRPTTWLALVLCALFGLPAGAAAQYFGQNKVQYETFDFRVMHTPHFDIYYYPAESLAAYDGARMAERWYARHATQFNYQLSGKKPIIYYADHPDWEQTNVVGEALPEGVGGVTEPLMDRVTLPFTGNYADNDHVIGHELVHSFQYDIAENPAATAGPKEGSEGGGGGLARMDALPSWLIEGMAEYLSIGRIDPLTAMWMRDAALFDDVPTIKDLTYSNKYFPYRYGQALWAYIGGRWGDAAVADVYRASLKMGWDNALVRVLGVSSDTLSKQWNESIRQTYLPTVAGRTNPNFAGERVIVGKENSMDMNVAPTVSPDGKYVAFYSSRGLFSTELYVADARTGKIVKQLTHPSIDSHFDALNFVYAAGTWSPDSRQFAFITTAKGNNEITILDVGSGHTVRNIRPKNVGALNTIAWSPDGTKIAFSGMHGGISDLYIYDLKSGELRQMMDDRYADLQPAWSPDGSTIAFATDRGPGTSFDSLTYSPLGIGLLDVASGAVRMLPTFTNAQSINPQYAPDGRSIYFIGNPGGFPDIYRVDLASGQLYEVTKLATGVSGITATSPALSVASKSGRVMFSVFEHGGYGIYGLEENVAQGQPVTATTDGVLMAGALPPWNALQSSTVVHQLRDPLTGLPPAGTVFAVSPYNAGLSLEYIGTPGVGVAVGGPFGTGAVGGVALAFGDILGNRTVGAQLGVQGSIKNTAGQLYYLNSRHRWNWFVSGSHIPYLTGFTDAYVQNFGGGGGQAFTGVVYRQVIQRQYDDAISVGAQYPFSTTRRFEINAGYRHLAYGTEVDSVITDLNGIPLAEGSGGVPSPSGLNLAQAGAALVGDNTFFGFTSPVSGTRYRIEADPTIGDLTFTTAMLDFRRYFFFTRPVTIAFRGLTYGRYGKDAESNRFFPLFVGDPVLIRGYDFNSFTPSECATGNPSGNPNSCPVFDRLLGSKIAAANFELRIPLIGTQAFGLLPWGFIPVEIAPFFDAGVAWDSDSTPKFTFSETSTARIPVFSTGISARLNVLGYVVAELYYAHPFQRPGKNWVFGFQLQPGW
ncbi:MAG TPA: BamA/TamA family outer membrane protein [Gemmatimonadaceae bacterium]|nr:BamA/TamA family outer membrane protein [Gemmatimonadaceae bacterium]